MRGRAVRRPDGQDGANGANSPDGSTRTTASGNGRKTFGGAGFGTLMMQMSAARRRRRRSPPRGRICATACRLSIRMAISACASSGRSRSSSTRSSRSSTALPAHFDPNHAPPDVLGLLAAWLGVDLDETQDIRHQREMVRRSAELGRRRGTVKGLELALKLHFPEVPMRVEDNGGVIWHGRPAPGREARGELRRLLR